MEKGIVERVLNTEWPKVDLENTLWKMVKVEGRGTPLVIHINWFRVYGDLKPGDEVEFEAKEPMWYQAVEGCDHVKNLRVVKRAEEKAPEKEFYEEVTKRFGAGSGDR